MNKGFTLLEVIAAILVIATGVLAAFNVVQTIISYTLTSASRLEAVYLAKEGIENVRNIRDSYWLQNKNWIDGTGATDWVSHPKLTKYETKTTIGYQLEPPPSGTSYIKAFVSVEVRWEEKGNTHSITVNEELYNWF